MRKTFLVCALLLASLPAQASQRADFVGEVNKIRGWMGFQKLVISEKIQSKTNKHAEMIKENGCLLFVKEGVSVSTLGTVEQVFKTCKGGICRLTAGQARRQSVRDEAQALVNRGDNNLYHYRSTIVGVSLAICGNKTVVVTATH